MPIYRPKPKPKPKPPEKPVNDSPLERVWHRTGSYVVVQPYIVSPQDRRAFASFQEKWKAYLGR